MSRTLMRQSLQQIIEEQEQSASQEGSSSRKTVVRKKIKDNQVPKSKRVLLDAYMLDKEI